MEKDWIGTEQAPFKIIGASNHCDDEREQNDFYATDPEALEPLLMREKFSHSIWEPACGMGHLSKRLKSHGFNVKESDIIDRMGNETIDFLQYDGKFNGDIITNPPYSKAKEFCEKALEVIPNGNKVAMFLKLTFLEGKARRKFFEKNPPFWVYVFSDRQRCARNGDFGEKKERGAVCYAWFVWLKGYKWAPHIDWI